jgi:hypothetical protein
VVLELDEPYFVGEGLKLVANAIVVPRRCSDELQPVVSEEKNADFFVIVALTELLPAPVLPIRLSKVT